ncbi:MAG TPA: signal peptide peptidase SppA [Bdellovibrionota bacterium]|nr:signal peptide peptidase SppA [Bdellovibrionota bacterium]
MNERRPSRLFRFLLLCLLLGIFVELFVLIEFLAGKHHGHGNVAVVEIREVIDDSFQTVQDLKDYTKDDEIKAIVLRVDSPGGAVGASQEIHDAVVEATKKKKVVVSMGDVAASGGYYVSAPAHKIVANPGTLTGSIGVIAHFFVVEDLLKKAFLRWEVIKSGSVKDLGSPLRSMTEKERKLLQEMTDDIHSQFIQAVAEGRKMPVEKVRELADGRVMSGRQAKEAGLVDEFGGLEKAIEIAAKLAQIKDEPEVIYPERERFGWIRRLAEGKLETKSFRVDYRLFP